MVFRAYAPACPLSSIHVVQNLYTVLCKFFNVFFLDLYGRNFFFFLTNVFSCLVAGGGDPAGQGDEEDLLWSAQSRRVRTSYGEVGARRLIR